MQLPYLLLYWNTKAVIKEWFCSLQVMLYHKRLCRCCGNGLDFSLSIHGLSSWEIHIRTGVAVFSYLMEGLEKMEPAFFLVVLLLSLEEKEEEDQSKRRRDNRHKMELRKFWLDMRKKKLPRGWTNTVSEIQNSPTIYIPGGIQVLTGHNPEQPNLSGPTLSKVGLWSPPACLPLQCRKTTLPEVRKSAFKVSAERK